MQIVSENIRKQIESASWIRRMFEKGMELKKTFGPENVFDFSLGNPDIPPPPRAREVLHELAEHAVVPQIGRASCRERV